MTCLRSHNTSRQRVRTPISRRPFSRGEKISLHAFGVRISGPISPCQLPREEFPLSTVPQISGLGRGRVTLGPSLWQPLSAHCWNEPGTSYPARGLGRRPSGCWLWSCWGSHTRVWPMAMPRMQASSLIISGLPGGSLSP